MDTKKINLPLSKDDVFNFKVGDMLLLSGQIVTGRDKAHKFLVNEKPAAGEMPFDLNGGIIYHCGPIIKDSNELSEMRNELKEKDSLNASLITHHSSPSLIAAGPTTSMRVEMYEADVIKMYGIRGIIGKGGMGEKTLNALKDYGCVYFHTMSGTAVYLADRIKRVVCGWKIEEFGAPEAMWLLEVEDFPVVVTMDAHGNSLHREIEQASFEHLKKLLV